jgi:HlyD family secretion protein
MSKGLKVFSIVFIVGIIGCVMWLKTKDISKIADYEITSVSTNTIVKNRFISGTILPLKEIKLIPQISGIIEQIYVKTGDQVEKGTPIAKIKLVASPESVERAEKTLKITELTVELNEKDYLRNQLLFKNGVIAKSEFETIESKWILSKEDLLSAKKQLQIVKEGYVKGKKNVSNVVTSTIKGTVLELPQKIGASVTERNNFNEGSTIAIIADMNQLIFTGKINEKDLFFLQEEMLFNVAVGALNDKQFKTKLNSISPKGVIENGIVKFEFEGEIMTSQTDTLPTRSGYSGIAEIILEKADSVLSIEEKDIVFRNDSAFVELIIEGELKEKHIVTGISDGVVIEVKQGLGKTSKIKIQE